MYFVEPEDPGVAKRLHIVVFALAIPNDVFLELKADLTHDS